MKKYIDKRLEIDRFFRAVRATVFDVVTDLDGRLFEKGIPAFQNETNEDIIRMMKKSGEAFIYSTEPKRKYIINGEISPEGFNIYYHLNTEDQFKKVKKLAFKHMKAFAFMRFFPYDSNDVTKGYIMLMPKEKRKNPKVGEEVETIHSIEENEPEMKQEVLPVMEDKLVDEEKVVKPKPKEKLKKKKEKKPRQKNKKKSEFYEEVLLEEVLEVEIEENPQPKETNEELYSFEVFKQMKAEKEGKSHSDESLESLFKRKETFDKRKKNKRRG